MTVLFVYGNTHRVHCSDLRASVNGNDVPEDIKARLLRLHEENVAIKEQLNTTQGKLTKAKAVSTIIQFSTLMHD